MNRAYFAVAAFFWLTGWHNADNAQAINVSQGEQVTLTLELVNVGTTELRQVNVQLDTESIPVWIQPETKVYHSVFVPAKSAGQPRPSTIVPITFTVLRQARPNTEAIIGVLIHDGEGHSWKREVPIQVQPTPKPNESQLLQNYPNPFNPETWIPYQLAQSTDVSIQIYDANGRRVRTLQLGHRQAGFYSSRTEAAYWDGRNQTGEQVSSGLYFYRIETDHFSAMGKMSIVK